MDNIEKIKKLKEENDKLSKEVEAFKDRLLRITAEYENFRKRTAKEKEGIYAKCTECGGTPEKIYIDSDGIQVSYEAKLLNDIKELMYQLDQRICNLEVKLQDLEGSQGILEESLAYINRYLVEKN